MAIEQRKSRGATIILIAAATTIALTLLGYFTAEVWHVSVVRRQLRNACDAAGLATAAALASSSYPSLLANKTQVGAATVTPTELRQARDNATTVGMQVFKQNSVCGRGLNDAMKVDDAFAQDPGADQVLVSVGYYDQNPTGKSLIPDPTYGKHIVYLASISVTPLFGIPVFGEHTVVKADGRSASAVIDLAFCLDNSLSMAANTLYYSVQRTWSAKDQKINYINPMPSGNPGLLPASWKGSGPVYPLNINTGSLPANFNAQLRGPSDSQSLPGNYSQPNLSVQPTDFTDVLVMPSGLDGANSSGVTVANDSLGTFVGGPIQYTYKGQSYSFANVATMLEAQRGNLENPNDAFYINWLKPLGLPTMPGYAKAYQAYGMANTEPFHSEIVQISNFFALLQANTDTHFCLIPFSAGAGTASPGIHSVYPVGSAYDPLVGATEQDFPFLQVELNKTDDRSSSLNPALEDYHLYGGTSTGAGLTEAVRNLIESGQSRIGARRITMLLSDGEPTDNPSISTSNADTLGSNGIPIFPIAFLHGNAAAQGTAFAFMKSVADAGRNAGGTGSTAFTMTEQNMTALQLIFRQVAHQIVTLE